MLLLVGALLLALYPLRKQKVVVASLVPLLLLAPLFIYWQWGGWAIWQQYLQEEIKQQHVQKILTSISGPQELIIKLKEKLNDKPESAHGWYLLGRLYSSQNEPQLAYVAYAKAHLLQPNDEQITVNYAQSKWELNQRQFDQQSRDLFHQVLQKNPRQPDALAMLALDAFKNHAYQQAIIYWQRLLKLLPPDSVDAKAIRKAIVKAEKFRENPSRQS